LNVTNPNVTLISIIWE